MNTLPNGIIWRERADDAALPAAPERILIFSPDYPAYDAMQVRVIDVNFFKICTEATHWAPINIPS